MPLETPGTNHGLNSICTSYYFKSLHSRFAEYQKELEVCSLLQFHVHDEIANVKAHVVTHTRDVQISKFAQCRHSAYSVMNITAPSTVHAFKYCHRLAFCGSSIENFYAPTYDCTLQCYILGLSITVLQTVTFHYTVI